MSRTLILTSLIAALLTTNAIATSSRTQLSNSKKQLHAEVRSEGRSPTSPSSSTRLRPATTDAAGMAKPTAAEVGDADTFGRNVVYAGLINTGTITMAADCTTAPGDPMPGPDDRCITIQPGPATTTFDLPDIGRMTLPGKSSHNILCHWLSPIMTYSFFNNTGVNANGLISLSPYLQVQSEVLNDPSLIDPNTGLAYNGQLETGFAASYRSQHTLAPNETDTERSSESRVCIGGTISRQGLISGYGFTDAQVDKFFKKPMTIKFGLRGSASLVNFASLIYGLRIMGD